MSTLKRKILTCPKRERPKRPIRARQRKHYIPQAQQGDSEKRVANANGERK